MADSAFAIRAAILSALVAWSTAAHAEILTITDAQEIHALGPSMQILEDPDHALDWTAIQTTPVQERFQASNDEKPNLGLTQSTVWIKVTLRNGSHYRSEYFLVLEYPLLDHLDLLLPGSSSPILAGDQVPRPSRREWQRTPRFPVTIQPGETKTMYLRAQTEGALQLPLYLYAPEAFQAWEFAHTLWGGALFGLCAVMVVYSLIYGLALRSLTQLSYAFFLTGTSGFVLTQLGMGLLLLWGPAQALTNSALVLAGGLTMFGAGIFFPQYLNAKRTLPYLRYGLYFLLPVGAIVLFAAICLPYHIGAILLVPTGMFTALITLLSNLSGAIRGYRPAVLGSVAWGMGSLGFSITVLKFLGLVPGNWFTDNSATIGILSGMLLQALANADRVLFLQREQLDTVKKHNEELETKVEERTRELARATAVAQTAQKESDDLLHKILPPQVAEELKREGSVESLFHDEVSVLFTDFQGFTQSAARMRPDELVAELDGYFSQFDSICARHQMEKLKTIGDSYMCASGIPRPNSGHAVDACLAAIEFREFVLKTASLREEAGLPCWQVRIGIHSGPVISGVIGNYKFAYDIWGDTVNTASRMESASAPGQVNLSENTCKLVQELFQCEARGPVEVKGKGFLNMYFLRRIKPEYSRDAAGLVPNDDFLERRREITEWTWS